MGGHFVWLPTDVKPRQTTIWYVTLTIKYRFIKPDSSVTRYAWFRVKCDIYIILCYVTLWYVILYSYYIILYIIRECSYVGLGFSNEYVNCCRVNS